MDRKVVGRLIAVSLLISSLCQAQTQPPKKRPEPYPTLFAMSGRIVALTRTACKAEECTKAADELAVVIKDGQDKHTRGILVDEVRNQFHADFKVSMNKLRAAVLVNMPEEAKAAMAKKPECPTCVKLRAVSTEAECSLCYDTYEILAEICALYLGTCTTCAIVCLATASLSFARCIGDYCPASGVGDAGNQP